MVAIDGSARPYRSPERWQEVNRKYLFALLDVLRVQILSSLQESSDSLGRDEKRVSPLGTMAQAREEAASANAELQGQSSLAMLVDMFGLSAFERDVLLLAAAYRLRPGFPLDAA